MIVKIPVTHAGISAIEEATYRGVSINATVSFSLPQCLAVAEAVERGLRRREKEGKEIATMGPVCTLMVGRLDDWLKVVMEKRKYRHRSGISGRRRRGSFEKSVSRIFHEKGYCIRRCPFRSLPQPDGIVRFIGGDMVISPPHSWQVRFNASDIEVRSRIDEPVRAEIVDELSRKFADFRRAVGRKRPLHRGIRFVRANPAHSAPVHHRLPRSGCSRPRHIPIPNPDAA